MPLPAWVVGLGSSLLTSFASAAEARANRNFQERMSSTAHQREVRDLIAAGLNPVLSARGGGASTPSGSVGQVDNPVHSALAARQAEANISLTNAQAGLARTQAADISSTAAAGRLREITSRADLANLSTLQMQQLMPVMLEKAKAELQQTLSSARATQAIAALDEAALAGAENIEALEKRLGEAGPAVKFFFELVRLMRASEGRRR